MESNAQSKTTSIYLVPAHSAAENEISILTKIDIAEEDRFAAGGFLITYNPLALDPVSCQIDSNFLGVCNTDRNGEILFNALNADGVSGNLTLIKVVFAKTNGDLPNLNVRFLDLPVDPLGEEIAAVINATEIDRLNAGLGPEELGVALNPLNPTAVPELVTELEQASAPATGAQTLAEAPVLEATVAVPMPAEDITQSQQMQDKVTNAPDDQQTEQAQASSTADSSPSDPISADRNVETETEPAAEQNINSAVQIAAVEKESAEGVSSESSQPNQIGTNKLNRTSKDQSEMLKEGGLDSPRIQPFLWIGLATSILVFLTMLLSFFWMVQQNRRKS